MAKVVLFNKPFDVLCQFTDKEGRTTLADYIKTDKYKGYYPAGRLDRDSEGLVVLTNDGQLQHRISHPDKKLPKTYWVQVEGIADEKSLLQLSNGVDLNDGLTLPAKAKRIPPPNIWPRLPPIRDRQSVPTSWVELTISEGRNRQVRRMTAAVNLPTLRLIRVSIGHWTIQGIGSGVYKEETVHLPKGKPLTGIRNSRPTNLKTKSNPTRSRRNKK